MLETILDALDASPDRALYVGDSRSDIAMARAAGVLAVAVLTGTMSRQDAHDVGSDLILPSISDLIDVLGQLRQ